MGYDVRPGHCAVRAPAGERLDHPTTLHHRLFVRFPIQSRYSVGHLLPPPVRRIVLSLTGPRDTAMALVVVCDRRGSVPPGRLPGRGCWVQWIQNRIHLMMFVPPAARAPGPSGPDHRWWIPLFEWYSNRVACHLYGRGQPAVYRDPVLDDDQALDHGRPSFSVSVLPLQQHTALNRSPDGRSLLVWVICAVPGRHRLRPSAGARILKRPAAARDGCLVDAERKDDDGTPRRRKFWSP